MSSRRALGYAWMSAIFLTMLSAPFALAESSRANESAGEAIDVTVVGQNYCLGCSLRKVHGAAAQCSKYGHRHGLRVETAVVGSGKERADLRGRTLSYLDNDKSATLVTGEETHGVRVEVKGRLFIKESVIDVQAFKAL